MRAVVQRVKEARVQVQGRTVGEIEAGLLVLVGIQPGDGAAQADWLSGKLSRLRIFDDADGRMNLSLTDVGGGILAVSQFTLYADCRKGNRPSYIQAAPPEQAEAVYNEFVAALQHCGLMVQTGTFGAMMEVSLVNDGPVTLIIDTPAE